MCFWQETQAAPTHQDTPPEGPDDEQAEGTGFDTPKSNRSEASDDDMWAPEMGCPPDLNFDQCGYDNIDEVEEAEGLQHLWEVFDVDEGPVADNKSDNGLEDLDVLVPPQGGDSDSGHTKTANTGQADNELPADPAEWTWEMPLEDRWGACQEVMHHQIDLLQKVPETVKQHLPIRRKQLQEATVRANAKVYENKTVSGGTVVGCIARLEAIRATQPFAVIVDEASKVLEPLFFACFCPSTVKLEMIGDHRQLAPNLMDKFDFMRCNHVNVSMFERLIHAPVDHQVPCGVLAVQRRMRKDICDLTREYYTDVVAIQDHEVCGTKVLPGALAKASAFGGREVLGVQSHIFLWTHSGQQKRTHVGLSKINQHKAERSIRLAYYLTRCGVNRSSIAILTPYKGQLMLMRKLLLSDTTDH